MPEIRMMPPRVPVTDPKTGLISREWYQFLMRQSQAVQGAALLKTDDTNVTLTLGGAPSEALLARTVLTLGWQGQLAIARGGTGASTAEGARANLGAAPVVHDHLIEDVTGLQDALDNKASGIHNHPISDVTGLQDALDLKAPLDSPDLTGIPTAPTAVAGTDTTQIATTEFVQTGLAGKEDKSKKGAPNGYAGLDADGFLQVANLPAVAITDTFVVTTEASMLALTAQTGDVAIRTDLSETYILQGNDPTQLDNWVKIQTPLDGVTSVGLAVPDIFAVANSPVTGNGTFAVTLVDQPTGTVFAGPATGADAAPAFRSLVAGDIPDLSDTYATPAYVDSKVPTAIKSVWFTATAGQTVFTLPEQALQIHVVFCDEVLTRPDEDYTVTGDTTITFASALNAGTDVHIRYVTDAASQINVEWFTATQGQSEFTLSSIADRIYAVYQDGTVSRNGPGATASRYVTMTEGASTVVVLGAGLNVNTDVCVTYI